ncbi:MAG TPA: hypothetical protein VFT16_01900, partial [Candidatus Saccharimonadales bacterium]|nr:hypothetical protein [Candidatus Saccharimonadales bacterium]
KANGGFGRNQQINAARRLFSTGTGYDDLRQVQTTVNRVAGSNKEMASDILGFGNAETGKVGRLDLKTGYGRQMKLYQKMQDNGRLTNEDIEEGYMDAIKGNEALQMLRGKPIAVKNVMPVITKALATAQREAVANDGEAKRLMAIANDTSQAIEVRQDAAQKATAAARKAQDNGLEAGRLTSIIDQFQQSASMYASAANTQTVYQNTEQPTVVNIRQNIKQEGSNVTLIRDSRTGQLRSVNQAVTDPITGQTRLEPQYRDENEVNIHFQRGLEEQAPRTPNDPRNSGIL